MTFDLVRLRLHMRAIGPISFPPGKAGNVLRGAFGMLLHGTATEDYAHIFAPKRAGGPSGLSDPPRPFVIRAAHLDGCTFARGEAFHFDAHLFDTREPVRSRFAEAFSRWQDRAQLVSVERQDVSIDFSGPYEPAKNVTVTFVTPTELKAGQQLMSQPEFSILLARLRDRISTLRALYGAGPLQIDFRAMGERAAAARITHCDLHWHDAERRSSRTGQTHPLGGFTGEVEYEGDLGEFLPYLRAGQWTGVGRQTVWGKGEICFRLCS